MNISIERLGERFISPERQGRRALERGIDKLLANAPPIPDNDGKLIRVTTLNTTASLLREWRDRPRMRGSQDRMPEEEYQEALTTVPWFAPRYELQYEEPIFHEVALLGLSSKPHGVFGRVTSAQLSLVHALRPEVWVYNPILGRGAPELAYWASSVLDISEKRGEQKIRARESDLVIFGRFLSAATPKH